MESKAPTNLVFLDACRNNPLAENLKRTLMSLKRSVSLGRGLARVEPSGRDTLIAFAAAPGQEATDGADRNSPFTTALLQHMPKPGLEVSVMLKEVAADVRRDTRNSQRPQQLSDMTRPFYFVKAQTAAVTKVEPVATPELMAKPAPQAAAERPADDRALDVAFWNAAQSANDCDAVRAYIQRFPGGIFIELARLSERRLCVSKRQITVIDAPDQTRPAPAADQVAASVLAPPATSTAPSFTTPAAAATLPAPATTMAALPAPVAAAPPAVKAVGPTPIELARITQLELYRVGCGTSEADGQWSKATRESLRRFSVAAKVKLDLETPSELTIAALQKQPGRVCALVCGRGMQARGETCVAVKQQPAKKQQRARRQAPVEAAAAPPPAAPAPVASPMMGPPMGGMIFFGRRRF